MHLGVVVVSYNTRNLLRACLASVEAEAGRLGVECEIVVVDNGSTDGSCELVQESFGDVHLIRPADNVGYAGAVNIALVRWLGLPECPPRVLVLNPDTELRRGALTELLIAAELPAVALVGPSLEYADGRFQHAAFREPGVVQVVLDVFPVPRLTDSTLNGRYGRNLYYDVPFDADFVLGACMLVNMDAVTQVGPMDSGFFMYCEEMEWCMRFRRAGWRVLCAPAARVMHHAGAATSQSRPEMWVSLWRSRLRFFRIAGPAWRSTLLRATVATVLRLRALSGGAGAPPGATADERMSAVRRVLA